MIVPRGASSPGGIPPEARLFAILPGQWTISRTLPGVGGMTGVARFRAAGPDLLHYREDGHLTRHDGPPLEVFREYHYRLEPGLIRICFAEPGPPRTFHVLRMDGKVASDVHLCGQDTYTGHYEFPDDDHFAVRMRVCGPRKDYSIETTYQRAR
ncbi:hypothetical protein GCM10027445_04050 [Amycolatopsis endophytica]|uniref:DUF6314 domain-containing protein n=1 Tax=Amycolatopsis endophytica TaxID=860233 RepID=A0A853B935_9PSEU|nr:DUF6314 family protein [Amycolatopsis endophytica]NYI91257.1 hypothetical protein [Amycolatopsis endophytica]